MKIASILIGERHRKDLGDLQPLADSITEQGLLQPIGVTSTGDLVFGERRLKACQLLGWTEISTRTVNVTSIAAGEYAENEMRKDFTPSERVAIAQAVKVHNCAPLDGKKTREIAAARAGFGSHATLERAERVVEKGVPELVEAMDSGDVSIAAAAALAALPRKEQVAVVRQGGDAIRAIVGKGNSIKAHYKHPALKLENAANAVETIAEALASLDQKRCDEIPHQQLLVVLDRIEDAISQIQRRVSALRKAAA